MELLPVHGHTAIVGDTPIPAAVSLAVYRIVALVLFVIVGAIGPQIGIAIARLILG